MCCTLCRRPVQKPILVDGKGYGPVCARKVGDLLVQPQRRTTSTRRAQRPDDRQPALFGEAQP